MVLPVHAVVAISQYPQPQATAYSQATTEHYSDRLAHSVHSVHSVHLLGPQYWCPQLLAAVTGPNQLAVCMTINYLLKLSHPLPNYRRHLSVVAPPTRRNHHPAAAHFQNSTQRRRAQHSAAYYMQTCT